MNLFYSPALEENDEYFALPKEEAVHAIKSLRMKTGDKIYVTNGRGLMVCGEIVSDSPWACQIKTLEKLADAQKRAYRISLCFAPTKTNERNEWLVEKATEIGVDEIIPVICSRSERKILKKDRLEKVMTAAAKQSLKSSFPAIGETITFSEAIKTGAGTKLIAYCGCEFEKKQAKDVLKGSKDVCIFTGPEGDFTHDEINKALAAGFVPISLGSSRLRAETAAVFSVAMISILNS